MAVGQHLLDDCQRKEVLQDLERHVMTQLVIFGKVTYAKGHQEAPFIWHQIVLLIIVCHIWTSSSYLNGIGGLSCRTRRSGVPYPLAVRKRSIFVLTVRRSAQRSCHRLGSLCS